MGTYEVPHENGIQYYTNMVTLIVVLASAVGLYLCGGDQFPPEILVVFCFIHFYILLEDIVFVLYTKRYNAACYKNFFIILLLSFYSYFKAKPWSHKTLTTALACGVLSGIYHCVQKVIHAKCEREQRLYNEEVFTLNSGSMLAYGYYYGYLKLILPGGRGLKGIREKIEDFINHHEGSNERFRELFPVKKLFILIPSSSFSYDEPDFGSGMESAQPLEEHTENRALTRDRVYKNTVYVIKNEATNKRYYVLPEIATPTKTLYETCKEQKHVAEYTEEIVTSFYYTLQRLLDEDPTCGTVCELIYYKDSGKSSERVNLADIIINRIEENIRKEKLKTL